MSSDERGRVCVGMWWRRVAIVAPMVQYTMFSMYSFVVCLWWTEHFRLPPISLSLSLFFHRKRWNRLPHVVICGLVTEGPRHFPQEKEMSDVLIRTYYEISRLMRFCMCLCPLQHYKPYKESLHRLHQDVGITPQWTSEPSSIQTPLCLEKREWCFQNSATTMTRNWNHISYISLTFHTLARTYQHW